MAREYNAQLEEAQARVAELEQPTLIRNEHTRPARVQIGGQIEVLAPGDQLQVSEAGPLIQLEEA